MVQKLERSPLRISRLNQTTHIAPDLENSNQISLIEHALFQARISLQPSPPSALERVTVSHATLAEWLPSELPCHKKLLQREFILSIQALGIINVEVQKLVIPSMTVLISRSLPAYDSARELQELTFPFICCIRGRSVEGIVSERKAGCQGSGQAVLQP